MSFKDSPALALRDSKIFSLDYTPEVFREYFTSPYEQYAEHVGKKFKVMHQIRPGREETDELEAEDDMYYIEFEDGVQIEAFGHEVCVLKYENCHPLFSSNPQPVAVITFFEELQSQHEIDANALLFMIAEYFDNHPTEFEGLEKCLLE